jgi:hypothetical protein
MARRCLQALGKRRGALQTATVATKALGILLLILGTGWGALRCRLLGMFLRK